MVTVLIIGGFIVWVAAAVFLAWILGRVIRRRDETPTIEDRIREMYPDDD